MRFFSEVIGLRPKIAPKAQKNNIKNQILKLCALRGMPAWGPHGICALAACCFGLLWLGLVYISVVVVRLQAGGRPAATPFSCIAMQTKKKKRDRCD
jgi:hypothetical protein